MTYSTNEALRVPLTVEGRDVVVRDGFGTAAALGCKEGQVVGPTVGLPILLMETLLPKLLPTVGTEKVLGTPVGSHGRHAFL